MENFKENIQELTLKQKLTFLGGIGVFLILIIIFISAISLIISDPKVKINFTEHINIPDSELRKTRENLYEVIKSNSEDFNENTTFVGNAREYQENSNNKSSTATFIVDFDDIKQSYSVSITWPDLNDGSLNIIISCPLEKSKYPETPCDTEANSSSDITGYLPYSGTISSGETYNIVARYNNKKVYLEIQVNSCGNEIIINEALKLTKEWISSIHLNPDDYLFYTPVLCDGDDNTGSATSSQTYNIQSNNAKTKDENVNKFLPYFIPNQYNVYPITDEEGNITSITAELSGCTDYTANPQEEDVREYLNLHNIKYSVIFKYCAL